MKNYKSIVIASLILSGVLMYSCKKKSNSGSLSNILIATVDRSHSGSIAHYRFVYDAINDVDSIISTGGGLDTGHNGFTYFTYFGNTYTATDENNNSYTITDSGGVIQEIAIPDTVIVTYYRSLPSVLTIKSPSPYIPYYVATIADYSWANGDINYINIQGGATETYTYNTAKNGQIGDGCRIDDFLSYGKPIFKTNHLPVAFLSNSVWVEQYYYQYDNAGRISQLTKVGNNNGAGVNDTVVYNYTYYY